MKHVANRGKSAVKPKAKTLTQVKVVKKTKPAAKKPAAKVVLNSRKQASVQKTKNAAKVTPKKLTRVAKPSAKNAAPKLSAKTLNALQTVSNRKPKSIVKQIETPKTKKIASKFPAKSAKNLQPKAAVKKIKSAAQKSKAVSSTKKTVAEKKITKPATKRKLTLKTANTKPKPAVKINAKIAVKTVKPKTIKATVQKTKPRLPKVATISTGKIKNISQKANPVSKAQKPQKSAKKIFVATKPIKTKKLTAPTVKAKIAKRKPEKIQIAEPQKLSQKSAAAKLRVESKPKKVAVKAIKAKSVIEPKKAVEKTEKFTPAEATENIVWKRLKFKPAISAAKTIQAKAKIKKEVIVEKIKPVEFIEEIKPRPQKPKKGKPIGSAVFRGKKEQYDFKVFDLNEKFEPIPAVYIISKRKTDRHKKGHHALICIGTTDSIADEIKRHRKGKCVKKHAANVVSILPEGDEKIRLKIETDLKAAHSVACNFE